MSKTDGMWRIEAEVKYNCVPAFTDSTKGIMTLAVEYTELHRDCVKK